MVGSRGAAEMRERVLAGVVLWQIMNNMDSEDVFLLN